MSHHNKNAISGARYIQYHVYREKNNRIKRTSSFVFEMNRCEAYERVHGENIPLYKATFIETETFRNANFIIENIRNFQFYFDSGNAQIQLGRVSGKSFRFWCKLKNVSFAKNSLLSIIRFDKFSSCY